MFRSALISALCLVSGASAFGQMEVDKNLPYYGRASRSVTGSIKTEGSDTMNNLMTLWAEGFRRVYPAVQIEVQGKGSSTAPAALIEGTATFGPMSRPMKGQEIDAFKKRFGYAPTALTTSIDTLAVIVHKDNPLASLSLQQVDAIFSKGRNGGFGENITTWGQLGLTGEWATKPISLYGRNSASGTYGFFKEHAMLGGDFKDSVKEQPGTSAVVSSIAHDRFGIGYSGIGYATADVRVLPLARDHGGEAVEALPETAYDGSYPLARPLFVYVNYKPNSQLDPLRREFVRYIYSREGQRDVIDDGYMPITRFLASRNLQKVGLNFEGRPLEVSFQVGAASGR